MALVASLRLDTEFYLPHYVLHRTPREEIWDAKEQVGHGGFGSVRREELRVDPRSWISTLRPRVRAVKQMRKVQNGPGWDYRSELEAIVKFSQPEYDPHFVRTFGWFEDADSVFLAMEYLPAGDLEGFKNSFPTPFSEFDTAQIVWQLIVGVRHMHENGFAHRDLKPSNILISSVAPNWQVKIADFGISKQTMEGVTRLHTTRIFGTLGYMAPEVLGFFRGNHANNDGKIAYTMSVDIWAVGIIAMTLLLKRDIFPLPGHLYPYIKGDRPLDFTRREGPALTRQCREFVALLLEGDPVLRPTAATALAHQWLQQVSPPRSKQAEDDDEIPDSQEDDSQTIHGEDELLPVRESSLGDVAIFNEAESVTPTDSGASTDDETPMKKPNKQQGTRAYNDTLIRKFKSLRLDSVLLSPSFQGTTFDTVFLYWPFTYIRS